ncbi:MAG: hypothetical protein WAT71_13290 [Ignavibacteria bacterium]
MRTGLTDKLKSKNILFGSIFFIIFLILCFNIFEWVIDDLYIYFRYVNNFTNGEGIVFNKDVPVEGFSSFSWFMILSFFNVIGLPLEMSAKISGLIFVFVSLICLFRICNETGLSDLFLPAVCLMLFNLPFILWAVSGFELMMFIFILLLCFLMVIRLNSDSRYNFLLTFLIFLLSVSRPEGVIFSVAFIIYIYIFSGSKALSIKHTAGYMILFSSFLVFRIIYFGEFLPNTYFAKIGHDIVGYYEFRTYKNGIFYILYFLKSNPQFVLFIFLLPIVFKRIKTNKVFLMTFTIIALQFFFIIFSGGDWMVQYRFAVVSIPFLSIGIIIMVNELSLSGMISNSMIKVLIILIFTVSALSISSADRTIINKEIVLWNNLKTESAKIKNDIPPGSIVANGSSGIIPFYLDDVTFIDIVGLTDKYIAKEGFRHGTWFERSLPEYVYSLDPEWLIMWKKKNSDGIFTFEDASPCYIDMAENENFSKYEFYKDYNLYSDVKIELYKKNIQP